MNAVGAGSAAETTDFGRDLLNISARSPTVLCFIIQGDEDAIYAGHSPLRYPGNNAASTGYDNLISVFVGNDINSASTFTFLLTPSLAKPTHVSTLMNTSWDQIHAHKVMLTPPSMANNFVTVKASGRYSFLAFYAFYDNFLHAEYDTDGDHHTAITPLIVWWCFAAMNAPGARGTAIIGITGVTDAGMVRQQQYNRFMSQHRGQLLARIGHGGPSLSAANFRRQHGVTPKYHGNDLSSGTGLRAIPVQQDLHRQTWRLSRPTPLPLDRRHHRCTDLPKIHVLLSKAPKRTVSTPSSQSCTLEREQALAVPLTAASALVSTMCLSFKTCSETTNLMESALSLDRDSLHSP